MKETGVLGCTLRLVSTLISTFILCAERSIDQPADLWFTPAGGPDSLKGGRRQRFRICRARLIKDVELRMFRRPSTEVVMGLEAGFLGGFKISIDGNTRFITRSLL